MTHDPYRFPPEPDHDYNLDPHYHHEDRKTTNAKQSLAQRVPTIQPARLFVALTFLAGVFALPSLIGAQGSTVEPAAAVEQSSAEPGSANYNQTPDGLVNGEFSDQVGWSTCAGADATAWDLSENHLRIVGSGATCVFQTVAATQNADYKLTCVSYEEGAQATAIRLSALDINWQTLAEKQTAVTVGSSITALELTAPPGSAHIGVTFDSPGVGYSSYDRCELNKSVSSTPATNPSDPAAPSPDPTNPSTPTTTNNLLANGDFSETAGWTSCEGAATHQILNGQLVIGATASLPVCVYQEVAASDNDTAYSLTCTSNVSSGYTSLTLSALDDAYAELATTSTDDAAFNQALTLTPPPQTARMAVTFYGEGSSTHDDCVLSTSSNPSTTPATPSPTTPGQPPSASGVTVSANEFYRSGGADYPWSSLQPGTVVNLVGNFQAGIKLTNEHSGLIFDGGHTIGGVDGWSSGAVFDGTGYATPDFHDGAIQINGAANITVQNFKIGNYQSQSNNTDPKAIFVLGQSSNVSIEKNEIFGFSAVHQASCHTGSVRLEPCGSAHGILISTEGPQPTTIRDVGIYSNLIYNMDLGKSEALTVKGDVQGFSVKFNTVHDTNNIGIDIAGFVYENVFYSTRNGVVEGNTVYNVDTRGNRNGFVANVPPNQAYVNINNNNLPNQSAACIYVDGGRDVQVLANRVSRCNIGISINGELATTETPGSESAQNVIVEGNLVYDSSTTGFKLGAGSVTGAGVEGCDIRNNAFYTNDADDGDQIHDGIGEIWLEYAIRNCQIRDNLFLGNSVRAGEPVSREKTVFTNTMEQPGAGQAVFANNTFYYQNEPSNQVARCQWISFANEPMIDCLSSINNNGGGGNVYAPIVRPDALTLPAARNY